VREVLKSTTIGDGFSLETSARLNAIRDV